MSYSTSRHKLQRRRATAVPHACKALQHHILFPHAALRPTEGAGVTRPVAFPGRRRAGTTSGDKRTDLGNKSRTRSHKPANATGAEKNTGTLESYGSAPECGVGPKPLTSSHLVYRRHSVFFFGLHVPLMPRQIYRPRAYFTPFREDVSAAFLDRRKGRLWMTVNSFRRW